jgi:hypothetical protein
MALENLNVKQKLLTVLQEVATLTVAFLVESVAIGYISVDTVKVFQFVGVEVVVQVARFSFKSNV